jgi:hypothetical protein
MSSIGSSSATQLVGLALAGAVAGAGATFVVTNATADAQPPAAVSSPTGTSQGTVGQSPGGSQPQPRQNVPQGTLPQSPQPPAPSHQWGGGGTADSRSGGS